jgi:hypothetical protein
LLFSDVALHVEFFVELDIPVRPILFFNLLFKNELSPAVVYAALVPSIPSLNNNCCVCVSNTLGFFLALKLGFCALNSWKITFRAWPLGLLV